MGRQGFRLIRTVVLIVGSTLPSASQVTQPRSASSEPPMDTSRPVVTFQSSTRMVTLELVATDHHGRHVSGLKASDFQVFEQAPSRGKEKHEQKIAAFREIQIADLAKEGSNEIHIPPGVYTNIVALEKDPVPATILLLDGLNTDTKHQAQVHVQMLRMLRSLPTNVPVAVFLLGGRLEMLQGFTTDPRILQAALKRAPSSAAGVGIATIDPRDDPNAISAQLATMPPVGPEVIEAVTDFEQEVYASDMDTRVHRTINALASIAGHVAGYPGRKNLLWISTAFPIYLGPTDHDAGYRNYADQLQKLSGVLSDAKVAVYPINAGGVEEPAVFQASTRPRNRSGPGIGSTLQRESVVSANKDDTMRVVADDTGGKICTGDNDLADCVRKAVDDSSDFYEIAYYSDAKEWNGEFRKIIVKARSEGGLHLAYRQGYFATPDSGESAKDQKAVLDSACQDPLNATSIFFAAKSLPSDSPDRLKFYLIINPSALTLTPTSDGDHEMSITVGVCTFDHKGAPRELMRDAVTRKFTPREYQLLISGGLPHTMSISGPKPAAVRLLVEDVPSRRLGSVDISVADLPQTPPAASTGAVGQRPAR